LERKEEQDSMTGSPYSSRILAVVLTCGTLLTAPLSTIEAEESAPRTQEIKPQQPKVLTPKTQELKSPEPAPPPPELKQEPSVRSLILTVKLALLSDQRTAPCTTEVDTKGRDVVLSGKVSSEAEKLASAEVTRQVEGVKSVANKLEVVTDLHQVMTQKRDQAITEYVRERFKKSATLEAARFDIKTENGVVELSGKTWIQVIVLEAAEAARQVPGVTAVKSHAVRIEGAE
jgi:osmotically-inducible protein OsmY